MLTYSGNTMNLYDLFIQNIRDSIILLDDCNDQIWRHQNLQISWDLFYMLHDVVCICLVCFVGWKYVSFPKVEICFFPWNITPLTTDRHFLLIGWIQFEMELLHKDVCYSHDVHIVFHIIINRFIKFYWLSSMIRSWKTISYLYTCHRIASQCWHFHYQL